MKCIKCWKEVNLLFNAGTGEPRFCGECSGSIRKQDEPLTLYNAPVGTMIENNVGFERKILSVLNDGEERVVLLSWFNDYKRAKSFRTAKELEENGWKVVQPKPKCKECGRELE